MEELNTLFIVAVHKGKFMKKVILGLIIVVVVGAGYYFLTNLDAIIKAAIEKHGSAATQTAVRVDKVRVKLTDGVKTSTGSIKGLTVASPKGFAAPHVFSLGEITLGIDLKSLKEEPYVVSEVTVLAPEIFIEVNDDRKVNLNELKKRLVSDKPQAQMKQDQASSKSNGVEPRLKIRRLVFVKGNIIAKVVPLNNKEYKLKLPSIVMKNIGGKTGATPTELTKEILNRVIEQAEKEFKKSSYGLELERLKAEAKAKINAAKAKAKAKLETEKSKAKAKVDAEKEKLKEKTESKLDTEKQKAKDKLKKLFGN